MKKVLLLFLIFSFCGGVSESETAEDTSSTTTTEFDADLALDNFRGAWERNLGQSIELSNEEVELTNKLLTIWDWKGDKTSRDEYLWEIQVNGKTCTRIWDRMGYAWTPELHPLEGDYSISNTYKCGEENERVWLYGKPFFYDGDWWIYQSVDFNWPKDCDEPCATSLQNVANKYVIEQPKNILDTDG